MAIARKTVSTATKHRPSQQPTYDATRINQEAAETFRKMTPVARPTEPGAMGYWDGGQYKDFAPGTSGQVLTSQGYGKPPMWSGAGVNAVQAVDISVLPGVQGAWSMEDTVTDRSGAGLDLDSGVSAVMYATIQGKRCAYRPPDAAWRRASHDADLAITGELTVHHLVWLLGRPGTNSAYYFAFMASGETSADNVQYSLRNLTGSSGDLLRYHSESGGGTDSFGDFDLGLPTGAWQLISLVRGSSGASVNLYLNGKLAGNSPAVVTAPDGGGSAVFALYQVGSGSGAPESYVGDTTVQNVASTAAQVLAVAQQVGVA